MKSVHGTLFLRLCIAGSLSYLLHLQIGGHFAL